MPLFVQSFFHLTGFTIISLEAAKSYVNKEINAFSVSSSSNNFHCDTLIGGLPLK